MQSANLWPSNEPLPEGPIPVAEPPKPISISTLPEKDKKAARKELQGELGDLADRVKLAQDFVNQTVANLKANPDKQLRLGYEKDGAPPQRKIDGAIAGLIAEREKLTRQFAHDSQRADTDPKIAAQLREIAFKLELLDQNIAALKKAAAASEGPPSEGGIPVTSDDGRNRAVRDLRKQDKTAQNEGKKELSDRDKKLDGLLAKTEKLAKTLNKEITQSAERPESLNKHLNARIQELGAQIAKFEAELVALETDTSKVVRLWDGNDLNEYHKHANRVKEKIQDLKIQHEAFASVFSDPIRAVLHASDQISTTLKGITPQNAGAKLLEAFLQSEIAKKALAAMRDVDPSSAKAVLAQKTLAAAAEELAASLREYSGGNAAQKTLRGELLLPYRIETFNDLPAVLGVLSLQLLEIGLEHHTDRLMKAVDDFEVMFAKLTPAQQEKAMKNKEFRALFDNYNGYGVTSPEISSRREAFAALNRLHHALDNFNNTKPESRDVRLIEAFQSYDQAEAAIKNFDSSAAQTNLTIAHDRLKNAHDRWESQLKPSPSEMAGPVGKPDKAREPLKTMRDQLMNADAMSQVRQSWFGPNQALVKQVLTQQIALIHGASFNGTDEETDTAINNFITMWTNLGLEYQAKLLKDASFKQIVPEAVEKDGSLKPLSKFLTRMDEITPDNAGVKLSQVYRSLKKAKDSVRKRDDAESEALVNAQDRLSKAWQTKVNFTATDVELRGKLLDPKQAGTAVQRSWTSTNHSAIAQMLAKQIGIIRKDDAAENAGRRNQAIEEFEIMWSNLNPEDREKIANSSPEFAKELRKYDKDYKFVHANLRNNILAPLARMRENLRGLTPTSKNASGKLRQALNERDTVHWGIHQQVGAPIPEKGESTFVGNLSPRLDAFVQASLEKANVFAEQLSQQINGLTESQQKMADALQGEIPKGTTYNPKQRQEVRDVLRKLLDREHLHGASSPEALGLFGTIWTNLIREANLLKTIRSDEDPEFEQALSRYEKSLQPQPIFTRQQDVRASNQAFREEIAPALREAIAKEDTAQLGSILDRADEIAGKRKYKHAFSRENLDLVGEAQQVIGKRKQVGFDEQREVLAAMEALKDEGSGDRYEILIRALDSIDQATADRLPLLDDYRARVEAFRKETLASNVGDVANVRFLSATEIGRERYISEVLPVLSKQVAIALYGSDAEKGQAAANCHAIIERQGGRQFLIALKSAATEAGLSTVIIDQAFAQETDHQLAQVHRALGEITPKASQQVKLQKFNEAIDHYFAAKDLDLGFMVGRKSAERAESELPGAFNAIAEHWGKLPQPTDKQKAILDRAVANPQGIKKGGFFSSSPVPVIAEVLKGRLLEMRVVKAAGQGLSYETQGRDFEQRTWSRFSLQQRLEIRAADPLFDKLLQGYLGEKYPDRPVGLGPEQLELFDMVVQRVNLSDVDKQALLPLDKQALGPLYAKLLEATSDPEGTDLQRRQFQLFSDGLGKETVKALQQRMEGGARSPSEQAAPGRQGPASRPEEAGRQGGASGALEPDAEAATRTRVGDPRATPVRTGLGIPPFTRRGASSRPAPAARRELPEGSPEGPPVGDAAGSSGAPAPMGKTPRRGRRRANTPIPPLDPKVKVSLQGPPARDAAGSSGARASGGSAPAIPPPPRPSGVAAPGYGAPSRDFVSGRYADPQDPTAWVRELIEPITEETSMAVAVLTFHQALDHLQEQINKENEQNGAPAGTLPAKFEPIYQELSAKMKPFLHQTTGNQEDAWRNFVGPRPVRDGDLREIAQVLSNRLMGIRLMGMNLAANESGYQANSKLFEDRMKKLTPQQKTKLSRDKIFANSHAAYINSHAAYIADRELRSDARVIPQLRDMMKEREGQLPPTREVAREAGEFAEGSVTEQASIEQGKALEAQEDQAERAEHNITMMNKCIDEGDLGEASMHMGLATIALQMMRIQDSRKQSVGEQLSRATGRYIEAGGSQALAAQAAQKPGEKEEVRSSSSSSSVAGSASSGVSDLVKEAEDHIAMMKTHLGEDLKKRNLPEALRYLNLAAEAWQKMSGKDPRKEGVSQELRLAQSQYHKADDAVRIAAQKLERDIGILESSIANGDLQKAFEYLKLTDEGLTRMPLKDQRTDQVYRRLSGAQAKYWAAVEPKAPEDAQKPGESEGVSSSSTTSSSAAASASSVVPDLAKQVEDHIAMAMTHLGKDLRKRNFPEADRYLKLASAALDKIPKEDSRREEVSSTLRSAYNRYEAYDQAVEYSGRFVKRKIDRALGCLGQNDDVVQASGHLQEAEREFMNMPEGDPRTNEVSPLLENARAALEGKKAALEGKKKEVGSSSVSSRSVAGLRDKGQGGSPAVMGGAEAPESGPAEGLIPTEVNRDLITINQHVENMRSRIEEGNFKAASAELELAKTIFLGVLQAHPDLKSHPVLTRLRNYLTIHVSTELRQASATTEQAIGEVVSGAPQVLSQLHLDLNILREAKLRGDDATASAANERITAAVRRHQQNMSPTEAELTWLEQVRTREKRAPAEGMEPVVPITPQDLAVLSSVLYKLVILAPFHKFRNDESSFNATSRIVFELDKLVGGFDNVLNNPDNASLNAAFIAFREDFKPASGPGRDLWDLLASIMSAIEEESNDEVVNGLYDKIDSMRARMEDKGQDFEQLIMENPELHRQYGAYLEAMPKFREFARERADLADADLADADLADIEAWMSKYPPELTGKFDDRDDEYIAKTRQHIDSARSLRDQGHIQEADLQMDQAHRNLKLVSKEHADRGALRKTVQEEMDNAEISAKIGQQINQHVENMRSRMTEGNFPAARAEAELARGNLSTFLKDHTYFKPHPTLIQVRQKLAQANAELKDKVEQQQQPPTSSSGASQSEQDVYIARIRQNIANIRTLIDQGRIEEARQGLRQAFRDGERVSEQHPDYQDLEKSLTEAIQAFDELKTRSSSGASQSEPVQSSRSSGAQPTQEGAIPSSKKVRTPPPPPTLPSDKDVISAGRHIDEMNSLRAQNQFKKARKELFLAQQDFEKVSKDHPDWDNLRKRLLEAMPPAPPSTTSSSGASQSEQETREHIGHSVGQQITFKVGSEDITGKNLGVERRRGRRGRHFLKVQLADRIASYPLEDVRWNPTAYVAQRMGEALEKLMHAIEEGEDREVVYTLRDELNRIKNELGDQKLYDLLKQHPELESQYAAYTNQYLSYLKATTEGTIGEVGREVQAKEVSSVLSEIMAAIDAGSDPKIVYDRFLEFVRIGEQMGAQNFKELLRQDKELDRQHNAVLKSFSSFNEVQMKNQERIKSSTKVRTPPTPPPTLPSDKDVISAGQANREVPPAPPSTTSSSGASQSEPVEGTQKEPPALSSGGRWRVEGGDPEVKPGKQGGASQSHIRVSLPIIPNPFDSENPQLAAVFHEHERRPPSAVPSEDLQAKDATTERAMGALGREFQAREFPSVLAELMAAIAADADQGTIDRLDDQVQTMKDQMGDRYFYAYLTQNPKINAQYDAYLKWTRDGQKPDDPEGGSLVGGGGPGPAGGPGALSGQPIQKGAPKSSSGASGVGGGGRTADGKPAQRGTRIHRRPDGNSTQSLAAPPPPSKISEAEVVNYIRSIDQHLARMRLEMTEGHLLKARHQLQLAHKDFEKVSQEHPEVKNDVKWSDLETRLRDAGADFMVRFDMRGGSGTPLGTAQRFGEAQSESVQSSASSSSLSAAGTGSSVLDPIEYAVGEASFMKTEGSPTSSSGASLGASEQEGPLVQDAPTPETHKLLQQPHAREMAHYIDHPVSFMYLDPKEGQSEHIEGTLKKVKVGSQQIVVRLANGSRKECKLDDIEGGLITVGEKKKTIG